MSQNQGTSFENDLGPFGIRTLNFGVHLETGITWNMVEFSMVLCCHHMKGRCFFTDGATKHQLVTINEAMEMYFQLMESYALDAGMALQCRWDPRFF